MKFKKIRTKTELEQVKEACKMAGFDYNGTPHIAEYDTSGNILFIETKDKKLQAKKTNVF